MQQFDPVFRAAGKQVGLPDYLIKSIAMTESGFNPNAKSPVGAQGMMQVMPFNSSGPKAIYKHDPFNPNQNILAGASIYRDNLNSLKKKYGNKFIEEDYWALAMGAYNAGEGRLDQAIKAASKNNKVIDASTVAKYLPAETREYIPRIQHYIKQFGPKPKSWVDDPAIAKMFNSNEVKQLNFKTAIKDNALKGNVREDTVNFAKVLDNNGLNGNMARFSAFNDGYKGHSSSKASHGSGHKFDLVLKDGSIQSYQQARQQVIELANQSGYDVVVSAEHPDGAKQGLEGFNWYPGKSTGAHLDIKVIGKKDGSYSGGSFNSKGGISMKGGSFNIPSEYEINANEKLALLGAQYNQSKIDQASDAEKSLLGLISGDPTSMLLNSASLTNSALDPNALVNMYLSHKANIQNQNKATEQLSNSLIKKGMGETKQATNDLWDTAKYISQAQAEQANQKIDAKTVLGENYNVFKEWAKSKGYVDMAMLNGLSTESQEKLMKDFMDSREDLAVTARGVEIDKSPNPDNIDFDGLKGRLIVKYGGKEGSETKANNLASIFGREFKSIVLAKSGGKLQPKEYSNEDMLGIFDTAYERYLAKLAAKDKGKEKSFLGLVGDTDYAKGKNEGMLINTQLFESSVGEALSEFKLKEKARIAKLKNSKDK